MSVGGRRAAATGPCRGGLPAALLVAAATVAVYLPVAGFEFVEFDDNHYVTANPRVLGGLTAESVAWAFTSVGHASNWHPLTWLSHMLDVELSGLDAGTHHLTSLALHAAAAALLSLLLCRLTGSRTAGALVAALFALHPLHVESAAWVAERKDVLSGFFFLLAITAWLRWLGRPSPSRYLLSVATFALSLLAKPMAVTLPFTLLLLDFWPLGRLRAARGATAGTPPLRLLWEKAPFFLLAAASAGMTWVAQRRGGSVAQLVVIPLGQRVANAFLSYATYAAQALWPHGLAPYYPYPARAWEPALRWDAVLAGLAVAAATAAALRFARSAPAAAVGWLWYLGTLVPVIGLVQVGMQSRADRYTYLPLVGLFVAATYGALQVAGARFRTAARAAVSAAALLAVVALGAMARSQVGVWRDSVSVFERILRENRGGETAPGMDSVHLNLGATLVDRGRPADAVEHFALAARARPDLWRPRFNLGNAYGALGRTGDAEAAYRDAIRVDPSAAPPWNNLGALLHASGRFAEAAAAYTEALRLDPAYADAHFNLGLLLAAQGRNPEAAARYREALRLKPAYPAARGELERLSRGR